MKKLILMTLALFGAQLALAQNHTGQQTNTGPGNNVHDQRTPSAPGSTYTIRQDGTYPDSTDKRNRTQVSNPAPGTRPVKAGTKARPKSAETTESK